MTNEMIVKKIMQITPEDITKYICEKATQKEVGLFLNICRANNLNPFKREAYLVKYKDDQPATILTGYEIYLKRAERSGNYGGFKVWIEKGENMKACIEVYRKDWQKPLYHEVSFNEYAQYKIDFQTKKRILIRLWNEKPETMLKKVAISQAFRWAFPEDVGGLPYTEAEISNKEEAFDSSKPIVQMPKSKDASRIATNAPGSTIENDKKLDKQTEKVNPSEYLFNKPSQILPSINPFKIITEKQGKKLLALVKDNGWTKDDVKNYAKDLGYEKLSLINEDDLKDFMEFFSQKKEEFLKENIKQNEPVTQAKTWEELEEENKNAP